MERERAGLPAEDVRAGRAAVVQELLSFIGENGKFAPKNFSRYGSAVEAINKQVQAAVNAINSDNEPAGTTILVALAFTNIYGILSDIEQERLALLKTLKIPPLIKKNGMIETQQTRYMNLPGTDRPVRARSYNKSETVWEAGWMLDHIIDSEIAEVRRMRSQADELGEIAALIRERLTAGGATKLNDEDKAVIRARIQSLIAGGVQHPLDTSKVSARRMLITALEILSTTEHAPTALSHIEGARQNAQQREQTARVIIAKLQEGRIKAFRDRIRERDKYVKDKAEYARSSYNKIYNSITPGPLK